MKSFKLILMVKSIDNCDEKNKMSKFLVVSIETRWNSTRRFKITMNTRRNKTFRNRIAQTDNKLS